MARKRTIPLTGEVIQSERPRALRGTTDEVTEGQMEALGTRLLTNQSNAYYLGISSSQYYEMLNRRPELRMALRRGRSKVFAKVSNVVLKAALDGNMYAAMQILKLKDGWRDPMYNADANDNDGEERAVIPGEPEDQTSGVLLLPRGIDNIEEWEKHSREQDQRLKEVRDGQRDAAAPTTQEGGVDTPTGKPD